MNKVKNLKVGDNFQMEGLSTNGDEVLVDAKMITYKGMNKYIVESDGITLLIDGESVYHWDK